MRRPRIKVIAITVAGVVGTAALVLGLFALPRLRKAGIRSEGVVLDMIRDATLAWQYEHPRECPTVGRLVSERWLDREFCRYDKCRCRYDIQCTDGDIRVSCTDHPGPVKRVGVVAPPDSGLRHAPPSRMPLELE
jgi:hypothetical protein